MANSALKRNDVFNGTASGFGANVPSAPEFGARQGATQAPYGAPYGQQTAYGQPAYGYPAQQQGYGVPSPEQLHAQYAAPAATRDDMDRMSYEDVIAKTAGLFAVLLVAAAASWFVPVLALLGSLGGLVLGFVLAFKKTPAPGLTLAFAAFEGMLVGGFSRILEDQFAGVVFQAGLATACVIGVTLLLFMNGKVRTSPALTKFVAIAALGYLLFSLANFAMMFTPFGQHMGMFGMRSVHVFGIPLGVIIGLFALFMGTYMLISDFEFIKRGVENGAPRAYGWIGAYSLISTVVYIYIEILRLIAIIRND